jgi:hypothetical protein
MIKIDPPLSFPAPSSKLRTMKRLLLFGLLMIFSAASGIEKGASRDAVLAELGEPSGSMRNGSKEILLFKTGTVTLQGGIVITADLSQNYARQAEERALKAKEIQEAKQAELENQKRLYPEDHVIQIECSYSKAENWEMLPESIRPLQGVHGYEIYIPQGYHESDSRFYPCLFLESPSFWDGVKARARKEKWIVIILREPAQPPIGKTLNGNFLAAYDDATVRFRITKDYRFIAGRMPSAIFAAMRPVAGIILQEPDFSGLQKNGIALDFLRRNRELRAYVLLSNSNRDNVAYQAQFVIERIPRYHIEIYQNEPVTLPPALSDNAIDWMKKEYALP